MWMARRGPERDRLNDYWNALNRGAPPEELARLAEALDPTVIAAIDRARALHRRRRPAPAFANRLERDLMNAFASAPAGSIPLRPIPPGPSNGRTAPRARPNWLSSLPVSRERRWVLAQLSTAILLLITLLGLYFTFHENRPAIGPGTPMPATPPPATPVTKDWSTFRGDAARRGEGDAGPTGQPVELWRFQAGGSYGPPPAVVGGVVYAACGDGILYALDAATGVERWRFTADTGLGGGADGPSVAEGVIYLRDDVGTLYAVDAATGQERWRFASPVVGIPAVTGGLLAIGTPDGVLLGIDAATGQERWRFAVTDQGAVRNAALAGGTVYASSEAGGFVAVDAATGALRWRAATATASTGTAVVADGIAYVGSGGDGLGQLYAFDAASGALRWRRDEPLYSPSVAAGVGYSGSTDGTVYAFDTATGTERWRAQVGGPARAAYPAGGIIYIPSEGDHAVVALAAATGAELWRFALDGGIDGSLAVTGGVVYVTTVSGGVYAIGGSGVEGTPAVGSPVAQAQAATPVVTGSPGAGTGAETAPVEFLWRTIGGPEPLLGPHGVTVAPDGNLWVADIAHSRFQIFAPDGTFLEAWGTTGAGEGEFNFVRPEAPSDSAGGVAFDAQGGFYVIDAGNHRIQRFDRERRFVRAWGSFGPGDGQFVRPFGIALDAAGAVYVVDSERDDIQKFDADGRFLLKFGGHGSGPGQFAGTGRLAIDDAGNVYVPDAGNNRIQQFTTDGVFVVAWGSLGTGPGQLKWPVDVAVDADGRVYVADFENQRIQVFDGNGAFLAAWGETGTGDGQFILPNGITLDGQGHAYVTDFGANTVQKFRLLQPLGPA